MLAKLSFVENCAIPKKNQTGGIEDIFFWNTPGNVRFMNLPSEVLTKTSFHLWKFCKIVWHPLEISSSNQKPRPMEIPHPASVFLEYLGKFVFFFNWHLDLPHAIYFNTPGNSITSNAFLETQVETLGYSKCMEESVPGESGDTTKGIQSRLWICSLYVQTMYKF